MKLCIPGRKDKMFFLIKKLNFTVQLPSLKASYSLVMCPFNKRIQALQYYLWLLSPNLIEKGRGKTLLLIPGWLDILKQEAI